MQTTNDSDLETGYPGLAFAREWPTVLFLGILTIGLGVVVLVWPSQTLTVLSILLGIQLVLFGLFRLISAFSSDTESPGFAGFVGIIAMIGGIIVLRNPIETVAVLATILGVVWVITGSIDVIEALANKREGNRLLLALTGLLSVAAGVIVVAWPAPTVTVLAWIAGLYLVIFGLFISASAFSLRHMADT
jgi:uncharacterized membrane protein HdeD (DUF308 family)